MSEEKVKKLKKRNAELAAIARRLEEKTKQLQQENSKVRTKQDRNPYDRKPELKDKTIIARKLKGKDRTGQELELQDTLKTKHFLY